MNTTYRVNDTETTTLCRYCVMTQPLAGLWKRGIDTTPDPCDDCGHEPEGSE